MGGRQLPGLAQLAEPLDSRPAAFRVSPLSADALHHLRSGRDTAGHLRVRTIPAAGSPPAPLASPVQVHAGMRDGGVLVSDYGGRGRWRPSARRRRPGWV